MTRQVLLFAAVAVALLLSMWLLLDVGPAAVLRLRRGGTPFSGLEEAFCFWIGLLAIALVRDYVVSRRDRNAVTADEPGINHVLFSQAEPQMRATQIAVGRVPRRGSA